MSHLIVLGGRGGQKKRRAGGGFCRQCSSTTRASDYRPYSDRRRSEFPTCPSFFFSFYLFLVLCVYFTLQGSQPTCPLIPETRCSQLFFPSFGNSLFTVPLCFPWQLQIVPFLRSCLFCLANEGCPYQRSSQSRNDLRFPED